MHISLWSLAAKAIQMNRLPKLSASPGELARITETLRASHVHIVQTLSGVCVYFHSQRPAILQHACPPTPQEAFPPTPFSVVAPYTRVFTLDCTLPLDRVIQSFHDELAVASLAPCAEDLETFSFTTTTCGCRVHALREAHICRTEVGALVKVSTSTSAACCVNPPLGWLQDECEDISSSCVVILVVSPEASKRVLQAAIRSLAQQLRLMKSSPLQPIGGNERFLRRNNGICAIVPATSKSSESCVIRTLMFVLHVPSVGANHLAEAQRGCEDALTTCSARYPELFTASLHRTRGPHIPMIASALHSIISGSQNVRFQQMCAATCGVQEGTIPSISQLSSIFA